MKTQKLIIIGGVAGGASAAARVRMLNEKAQIIIFERGPYVSFANCGLPYFIGNEITDRNKLLLHTPESLKDRFNFDVRVLHEVVHISREDKTVTVRNIADGTEYTESYDTLILSPGAVPFIPPIPGIEDERIICLRNIPDMDRILARIETGIRNVTVIGAGFIGLEMVEALQHRGLEVQLVERDPQILAPLDADMTSPLLAELQKRNITVYLNDGLSAVSPDRELVLTLASGKTIRTDLVILAIGVRPDSSLARDAGLETGIGSSIIVNEYQQTADPAIYAVGDAVQVKHFVSGHSAVIPLAGPANRQGRIAADAIFGRKKDYRGSQGTAICRLFDMSAGATGLNEKALKAANIAYEKVIIHGNDHAAYYPNATRLSLKVLFSKEDGTILGAQAVGMKGADKRIDVIATAIQARMTVYDLAEVELSYAPPFGSAKDIINFAGMVAQNMSEGLSRFLDIEDFENKAIEKYTLLDVRNPEEVEQGFIPGAINIPLSRLRQQAGNLPKDIPVILYCQVALRGHIAQRYLAQEGWETYNLQGGYTSWQMWHQAKDVLKSG